jgi:hypothetical protein
MTNSFLLSLPVVREIHITKGEKRAINEEEEKKGKINKSLWWKISRFTSLRLVCLTSGNRRFGIGPLFSSFFFLFLGECKTVKPLSCNEVPNQKDAVGSETKPPRERQSSKVGASLYTTIFN